MRAFHKQKELLVKNIKEADSNIYLLFNIWTSHNFVTFVAIIAYYINNDLKLWTTLIDLQQFIDSYFIKIIVEQIVQVI